MADNLDFRHLSLPMILQGKPKLHGGGKPSGDTIKNRNNRNIHGQYIKRRSIELSRFWKERRFQREQEGLPTIETGIPILLEIDPSSDIDFLRGLGFEIICEIEEGFIIVATDDVDLQTLNKKTDEFIANRKKRCNAPARIYALCQDLDRIDKILTPKFRAKWSEIVDNHIYLIDIGVSCSGNVKLPDKPKRKDNETNDHYEQREQKWQQKFNDAYMEWDEIKIQREDIIERFVNAYNGEILNFVDGSSDFKDLPDSFSARLRINGKCLRDLVLNFAYIFEVSESEKIDIGTIEARTNPIEDSVIITPPSSNTPIVCIVDSGIQEAHRFIAPAIRAQDSKSFIPGNPSVNDEVHEGGHGTRVAGAILFPKSIPTEGSYQLPCQIRNIRVLNSNNCLPMELFPPKIISSVVETFSKLIQHPTKIFNHSIGGRKSCELKHMSAWAAEMDLQSYENDVLFIQSSGNISNDIISALMQAGYQYPVYFDRELSRISDPAQSLQALTVGSIALSDYETEDKISLGAKNEVSSFSRSGPGIWDTIKPEVVEYGGTNVINKEGDFPSFTTPAEVCPQLIRKSPEGPAFSRDAVGTSFAAPKVAHIAAEIEKIFPNAPTLLYRALIAQSARWPDYSNEMDSSKCLALLRRIGYGLPDLNRATHNDDYRVTLITPSLLEIGEGEAHIFKIPIPEQLSSVGEDYNVLVEITLSYAAKPRRTRRYIKGYLSSWVDWCCSKIGENCETFARRVLETGKSIDDDGNFKWMIGESVNWGVIDGFSRKNGTLQKDWCTIKSNQLSDGFCIAVRGHKGWGSLFKAKYSLVVSLEAIDQDIHIYEPIRTMVEVEVEVENEEIEVEMKSTE